MWRRGTAAAVGLILLCAPASAGASPPGPAPGSPAYIARDVANIEAAFGRELGPGGQLENADYLPALVNDTAATELRQLEAQASRLNRLALTGGNLVPGYNVGNPLREGWSGTRGRTLPVSFTANDGALLEGTLFAPLPGAHDPYTGALLTPPYPGVVIVTGSIQASAGVYAWLAEDLAERGYLVLTFDVQGQGTSETLPHLGPDPNLPSCNPLAPAQGDQVTGCPGVPSEQNQNFVDSTEDAITFFLSTPSAPYPDLHAGTTPVNRYNPWYALFDRQPDTASATPGRTTRLALIGHSTGAVITSYLQGVDPRIETAVALDKITATPDAISDDEALLGNLPGPVVPKVPTLGLQSEYGFEPQPYWLASCSSFEPCPIPAGSPLTLPNLFVAPNPNREEDTGFDTWRADGVDSMVIVPRASTHLDYSDLPYILPASADGQAMASYYVQAWLDKYLKHEPGADARLLSPMISYLVPVGKGRWVMEHFERDSHLSFYFCSGYSFHLSSGAKVANPDLIGDGCP